MRSVQFKHHPFNRISWPQEYADSAAELVKLRREAKVNGNFFVEPEAGPGLNGWGIPP